MRSVLPNREKRECKVCFGGWHKAFDLNSLDFTMQADLKFPCYAGRLNRINSIRKKLPRLSVSAITSYAVISGNLTCWASLAWPRRPSAARHYC